MSLNKQTNLDAVISIINEKLDAGGTVIFTPNGTSMLPMLRDGKDVVMLKKPEGRLHLFDIPLYKRENGTYVLHRVIGFDKDGSYILCGDNQFVKEKGINDSMIIAVLTGFERKGKSYSTKSFSYRLYVIFWYCTRFFRHVFRSVKYRMGVKRKNIKRTVTVNSSVKSRQ